MFPRLSHKFRPHPRHHSKTGVANINVISCYGASLCCQANIRQFHDHQSHDYFNTFSTNKHDGVNDLIFRHVKNRGGDASINVLCCLSFFATFGCILFGKPQSKCEAFEDRYATNIKTLGGIHIAIQNEDWVDPNQAEKKRVVEKKAVEGSSLASTQQSIVTTAKDKLDITYEEDLDVLRFQGPENFRQAFAELRQVLGQKRVSADIQTRQEHEKDQWSYHEGKLPYIVAYPVSTEEVSTILKVCNTYNVPVVPYACGTSLEGNTLDMTGGLICNMLRMSNVIKFHEDDGDIVVQAGIQWLELNQYLKGSKYFFPMDPGPGAAIGGMIGTCCSGTNAVRYGTMKDWILGIKVVLANGDIVKLGTRARKDVAGYDLIRLFVGSEGTLGIVTEATLKLVPKTENDLVAVCSFPSTYDACSAVGEVVRRGISVAGAELLDTASMKIINKQGGFSFSESPSIFFRFSGTPGQLKEAEVAVREVSTQCGGLKFEYRSSVEDKAELDKLWQARKDLLFSIIGWGIDRQAWITDVCVPIGNLPRVIEETIEDIAGSSLDGPIFGHVGDGNFHSAILFHPENEEEHAEAQRLNERMVMRAIEADGTCSGEHGIGVGKRKFLKRQASPEALKLMKSIKKLVDPNGILNQNKIFFNDKDEEDAH